jgi:hypothetical protein
LIDFSGLPRQILRMLFLIAEDLQKRGSIARVFWLYTWAGEYPSPRYPTQTGELRILETGNSFAEWYKNVHRGDRKASALIIFGRQGFDARLLVETVSDSAEISLFGLLHSPTLAQSLATYRVNSALFDMGIPLYHSLTVEQCYEALMQAALTTGGKDQPVIFAPFSAKPMLLASLMCAREIQRRRPGVPVATVSLSAHDYGSVYSIGALGSEIYETSFV